MMAIRKVVVTLKDEQVRLMREKEILHARRLQAA
jgi:hypothetical protein